MATHTIGVGTTTFDGVVEGVNPGDIIKITASAGRDYLRLENIAGADGNEVIAYNDGGIVVIDCSINSRIWALEVDNCQYLKVIGRGHQSEWGIQVKEFSNAGLYIINQSEFCSFENIEVGPAAAVGSSAGIRCRTLFPSEAPSSFVMDGCHFRYLYVHDTVSEGAYIGKGTASGRCRMNDLVVEYCHFIDCGSGGIQLRHITEVQCQRNWVERCGIDVDATHAGGGLIIADGTLDPMGGHWRYNRMDTCERGVSFQGDDVDVEVHHNLIVDCGDTGGQHDPQLGFEAQRGVEANFKIYQNTIVDCGVAAGGYGINTKSGDANGEVENCIVVGSDTDIDTDWALDNNETGAKAAQNFRANDIWYHLTGASPDITTGWLPWV